MTREEAIYCMESYIDDPNYEHCTSCPYYGANQIGENVFVCNSGEAHKMAVEALKHESILDKIKSEINSPNRGTCDYFIVDRIEEIINEYAELQTESEENQ